MTDSRAQALDALLQAARSAGALDADLTSRVREALGKGHVDRPAAEALFALHQAAAGRTDPAWKDVFVEAVTRHVLGGQAPPRVLGEARADFLLARLADDDPVDDVTLDLLVNVFLLARTVPARFADRVLAEVKKAVLADGRIDRAEVDLIRRILHARASAGGQRVDRTEGEFLFDLNDATASQANHPSWRELFVDALTSSVLDDADTPGEVDPAEAAWLVKRIEADQTYDEGEQALLERIKHHVRTSEVWRGIRSTDLEAGTSGLRAGLFARACQGGKGGDIYYVSASACDLITRVALVDVMGHGPVVSDISQWLCDSLTARITSAETNEVLADLNRLSVRRGYRAMATGVVMSFTRGLGRLCFSYAGHPPLFIFRPTGATWTTAELEHAGGLADLPLGVDANVVYDQSHLPLTAGDQLFLYSDGVIEARDADGDLFGMDRLVATLNASAPADVHEIKQAVLDELERFTVGKMDHDDVTFMAIEVR